MMFCLPSATMEEEEEVVAVCARVSGGCGDVVGYVVVVAVSGVVVVMVSYGDGGGDPIYDNLTSLATISRDMSPGKHVGLDRCEQRARCAYEKGQPSHRDRSIRELISSRHRARKDVGGKQILSGQYQCCFIVGMGLGAAHVFTTWFMDFIPTLRRGAWMIAFFVSCLVGTSTKALLAWGIVERYGWRLLLGVYSLPSLVALFFYTLVPEAPRFHYAKCELGEASKILNSGAELNKRQILEGGSSKRTKDVTLDLDKIKDVTLDLDKTVEIKDVTLVTSEEDEIKDVTLDLDKTVAGEIQIDEAHHTLKKDDPVDRSSMNQEEIYPTQLRTLGAGVAIVVGRIGNIVLPLVGEGMISYDGNKTPAMIMFAFKISVWYVLCSFRLRPKEEY
uniref:Truncated transporter-related protein n=1 Tax=Tanacetum cinerariifolium TaxID=118510 RepID=A0A6L2P4U0_TANCI|nr:truncated transporter-related protein [Tanacetum cinerariifolium]